MLSLDLRSMCAILLIVGSTLNVISNLMFTSRSLLKWSEGGQAYIQWERGVLIGAFVVAATAVSLLEALLGRDGDAMLSRMGATAFVMGAVVALVVKASFLSKGGILPLR